ncbi:MAG: orotate phosphoribosyltransferase [Armatimonadota bacterium]
MSETSSLLPSTVDLGSLLESCGAVLHGHFLLSSGRHSEVYFEKFRVLEQADVLSTLCGEIAEAFRDSGIDLVAGPTTGGIIVAFEVARRLGLPALYVEREEGKRVLRRGASVPKGARVLVVDDVLTTGLSVVETIDLVQANGGQVVGVGVLIDRSPAEVDFGVAYHAAYKVEAESYAPDEVPAWLQEVPITKPGTRPS